MMNLHKDKEAFREIIQATSDYKGISEEYIEKDYLVSLLLQGIVEESPDIVFKGGTSLSKCYQLIERFSEDIDLTFKSDIVPNNKAKEALKHGIIRAINKVEMELVNGSDILTRRDFNQYHVKYPSIVKSTSAKEGYDILNTLNTLIEKGIYRNDYKNITEFLLFEEMPYHIVIGSLRDILDSGFLPDKIHKTVEI
ncbi:nucleotidyl transferase AbiEii/AbiGii toxin family protein [Lederbergia sp. NSJ-179]|uniref:nucleotidyl transferase AbiEii/AbiGii toxin family protein n=1 Tax=Lederbergia sp. NSJ-179 TaxID=2931402 RepID=UPI001FD1AFCB|nr:nucleotidyl transferase AbiEii/AbiGii toxin family protein [Lederbergia sp. NSJ-179]MCJ7841276.1 nucleotidyl transferase AbiEii/AbiGii toxin family protein [Lederbergia sp. NSJ-179]